jgi:hypothetical protein
MLGTTSTEDGVPQQEVERRLRLAFNSPGVSSTGVLNFAFPPVITGIAFVDVHTYGAVGDGTTDDRAAIVAASAAAATSGIVFFRPGKSYRITNVLAIAYDDQTWLMDGATIKLDYTGPAITIGTTTIAAHRVKLQGGLITSMTGTHNWTAGTVGIQLLRCNNCVLRDVSVSFLEKGIEITSPAVANAYETTQNWIEFKAIASCALPIYLYANEGGSVNENTFRGGQVSYAGTDPSATGRFAVTIAHHASSFGNVNGTKFYGTYFGCSLLSNRPLAVSLDGVGSLFSACHIEGFPSPMVTFAGDAITGGLPNQFVGGGANYLTPEADLASATTGLAAPWLYTGQDGAGIAGGAQAGSAYVWVAKVLGAGSKVAYAVKDASDAITFFVRGDGVVSSGKNTVEGAYRLNGPAASTRAFFWQTAGVARWDARATSTAEGGANAGSDWNLIAYNDAGSSLGAALTIARATRLAVFAHGIHSASASGGVGYTTGAGGTVAQGSGSGKATGVTLNTVTGLITMDGAVLNAGTIVSFTLTNGSILSTDTLILQHNSGGTVGAYTFSAQPGSGSAVINVRNATAGNLTEAPVIRFTVIKSVSS